MSLRALFAVTMAVAGTAQTVPALNATRYLGRWYQTYSDLPTSVFESRYCVTADYGLNKNGTISVLNRERVGSVTGNEKSIPGWAAVTDPSKPGELTVHLQGPPFPAPYWVYALGPQTYQESLYQYAIVSDPLKANLFVLARNVTEFKQKYDADVLAELKKLGFDTFVNKPLPTYHEGCTYW